MLRLIIKGDDFMTLLIMYTDANQKKREVLASSWSISSECYVINKMLEYLLFNAQKG